MKTSSNLLGCHIEGKTGRQRNGHVGAASISWSPDGLPKGAETIGPGSIFPSEAAAMKDALDRAENWVRVNNPQKKP